ncbi:MAG: hypothetical protein R2880_18645 [Deinococcales bacterium]
MPKLKRGDKAGFPRFLAENRFDSITYPQYQAKPTARSVPTQDREWASNYTES